MRCFALPARSPKRSGSAFLSWCTALLLIAATLLAGNLAAQPAQAAAANAAVTTQRNDNAHRPVSE